MQGRDLRLQLFLRSVIVKGVSLNPVGRQHMRLQYVNQGAFGIGVTRKQTLQAAALQGAGRGHPVGESEG